nr:ChaN family lipoprotein [Chroococcidiopsis sp. [FACHB-1243]]
MTITRSRALQELAKADAIYLGETHDRDRDRKIQLKIIQEFQKRNPQVAIAMEMFQIPYQDAIDSYLAGKLTEKELIEQTEYEQRWGYSWESYAPILRFAKEKQLSVLAANVPSEITRQVAKSGLDSLTPQQRKIIPPASEIRTDNAAYRQMLAKTFAQHQHSSRGNSSGFDRFFLAQVLWDETMAAEVAKFVKANPKHQVVVIAGQGHIIYGYGIPSRVARRMHQQFSQVSVLLSPPKNTATNSNQPIADYIWQ